MFAKIKWVEPSGFADGYSDEEIFESDVNEAIEALLNEAVGDGYDAIVSSDIKHVEGKGWYVIVTANKTCKD